MILHCFYLDFFKVSLARALYPSLPVQKLLLMRVNFGICAKFNRQAYLKGRDGVSANLELSSSRDRSTHFMIFYLP